MNQLLRNRKKILFLLIIFITIIFLGSLVSSSFAQDLDIRRQDMMNISNAYVNYNWTATSENILHESDIDTPNREYFTSWPSWKGWEIGANVSVPYQWGGWSSVENMELRPDDDQRYLNEQLALGFEAGDTNFEHYYANWYEILEDIDHGAAGVDCSGFISHVWRTNRKLDTGGLRNLSRPIKFADLRPGDLLYIPGHVMLFEEFNTIEHDEVGVTEITVVESSGYDWKVSRRTYRLTGLTSSPDYWGSKYYETDYVSLTRTDDNYQFANYQPRTYLNPIDIVLVIDRSGSMSTDNAMEAAKNAAKAFVDLMRPYDKIGIVDFDDIVSVTYPLSEIDEDGFVKTEAKQAIDTLYARGRTSIGGGLQAGQTQLITLGVDNAGNEDPVHVMVLLSDGQENEPPWIADVLPGVVNDEIVVNTIGLSGLADQLKLSNIATETGGVYRFTPTAADLWDIYNSISAEIYGAEVVRTSTGTIAYAGTVSEQVLIDSSIGTATFAVGWPGSDLDLTLIRPDGSTVDPVVALNDQNIEFVAGGTYEFYRIEAPQYGEWTLVINAISVPVEGEEYFTSVTAEDALSISVTTDRTDYETGMPIVITASIEDNFLDVTTPQYIYDVTMQVDVVDPNQNVYQFNLYDDGTHGDISPNDGLYTNAFQNSNFVGSYNFSLVMSGLNNRNHQAFTREHKFTTYVTGTGPCSNVTEIPQTECEALVAFYNSTNGDNWTYNDNWLATSTPSNWYGITVSSGHVWSIDLPYNGLSGNLPSEIGNFPALDRLLIDRNLLTGTIPPELGNLTSLQFLYLYSNQLTGSIPIELGNLTNLQQLILYGNQLTGSIPPELGNLPGLVYLWLNSNQLTGSIPSELGNLPGLVYLYLYSNQLTGSIPPELGNLTSLQVLYLFNNQLTGSIPPELGNLPGLAYLYLYSNQLTGSIPAELGNLTGLTRLYLHDNQLTGSIPAELGNLTGLTRLYLQDNQLTGSIPLSFINLPVLDYFYFYSTSLCEPTVPEYQTWKSTVDDYLGTGISCVREVDIAIQPSGHPPSIRCTNDKATIEVAILTTDSFDALSVDHTTVTFEGATEYHIDRKAHEPVRHEEDIDLDGDLDLIFHFRFGDTNLTCDSSEGTLIGQTYDGILIQGTDRIRMSGQ